MTSLPPEGSPTMRTIEEGIILGMTRTKMTQITSDKDLSLKTYLKVIKITETDLKVIKITETDLKVIKITGTGVMTVEIKAMTDKTNLGVMTETTEVDPSLGTDRNLVLVTEMIEVTPHTVREVDHSPGTGSPHQAQIQSFVFTADNQIT